jgi:hypothetical protein
MMAWPETIVGKRAQKREEVIFTLAVWSFFKRPGAVRR